MNEIDDNSQGQKAKNKIKVIPYFIGCLIILLFVNILFFLLYRPMHSSLCRYAPFVHSEIFDAVEKADLIKVQSILAKSPWLATAKQAADDKHKKGWTPLHYAVCSGNRKMCELLLAYRAEINAGFGSVGTPLHYADNKEIAELFIKEGAGVNAKDNLNATPLHYAALNGLAEFAEFLIAKGADVNAKEDTGFTPLHYAIFDGHKEVAELLIVNGADINAKMRTGATPLDYAIGYDHKEIAELVRKHGGVSNKDSCQKDDRPIDEENQ